MRSCILGVADLFKVNQNDRFVFISMNDPAPVDFRELKNEFKSELESFRESDFCCNDRLTISDDMLAALFSLKALSEDSDLQKCIIRNKLNSNDLTGLDSKIIAVTDPLYSIRTAIPKQTGLDYKKLTVGYFKMNIAGTWVDDYDILNNVISVRLYFETDRFKINAPIPRYIKMMSQVKLSVAFHKINQVTLKTAQTMFKLVKKESNVNNFVDAGLEIDPDINAASLSSLLSVTDNFSVEEIVSLSDLNDEIYTELSDEEYSDLERFARVAASYNKLDRFKGFSRTIKGVKFNMDTVASALIDTSPFETILNVQVVLSYPYAKSNCLIEIDKDGKIFDARKMAPFYKALKIVGGYDTFVEKLGIVMLSVT